VPAAAGGTVLALHAQFSTGPLDLTRNAQAKPPAPPFQLDRAFTVPLHVAKK